MKKVMKSNLAVICCVVMLLLPVLALPVQAASYPNTNFYVQVSSSDGIINFRSGPGTDYNVIGSIGNGTVLAISSMAYSPYDGFMWGSTVWNGYSGWVSLRQTTILTGAGYPTPNFYVRTAADGGSVNMRTVAGTSYPVIMEIPNGVDLNITGLVYNPTDGLFWGLVYYNGYYGWISLRQTSLKRGGSTPNYNPNPVPTPTYGTVLYSRNGEVNLRNNPSHNSSYVGTVYGGTPMYYYGENGFGYGSDGVTHEWYHVTLNNGVSGWVRSDLVW